MGYEIRLIRQKFDIPAEKTAAALKALRSLGAGSDHPQASGAEYTGGRRVRRWFSWMNTANPEEWHTLADAMDAWGYPVEVADNGSVVAIKFADRKIGDEKIMFATIAPFVAEGSYLEMLGEDGVQWWWCFSGGKLVESSSKVTQEEQSEN